MKIPTPVITLAVGVVLAASLLVSSMSAVSAKKAALAATSGGTATSGVTATTPPATGASTAAPSTADSGQPTAAGSTASASPSPSPSASASSGGFVIPPHANYDGEVQGNLGAVALVVHDSFAVAYFCNGSTQEAWFKGVPHHGKVTLTGTNGATIKANYALGHARGTVTVDGIAHVFSIIAVHRPSGLFQSIQVVRGAKVKAGWIVLADGEQVGSIEPNPDAAHPTAHKAPKLDVSSLTAQDDGTTLTANPIDGETGSGF